MSFVLLNNSYASERVTNTLAGIIFFSVERNLKGMFIIQIKVQILEVFISNEQEEYMNSVGYSYWFT